MVQASDGKTVKLKWTACVFVRCTVMQCVCLSFCSAQLMQQREHDNTGSLVNDTVRERCFGKHIESNFSDLELPSYSATSDLTTH